MSGIAGKRPSHDATPSSQPVRVRRAHTSTTTPVPAAAETPVLYRVPALDTRPVMGVRAAEGAEALREPVEERAPGRETSSRDPDSAPSRSPRATERRRRRNQDRRVERVPRPEPIDPRKKKLAMAAAGILTTLAVAGYTLKWRSATDAGQQDAPDQWTVAVEEGEPLESPPAVLDRGAGPLTPKVEAQAQGPSLDFASEPAPPAFPGSESPAPLPLDGGDTGPELALNTPASQPLTAAREAPPAEAPGLTLPAPQEVPSPEAGAGPADPQLSWQGAGEAPSSDLIRAGGPTLTPAQSSSHDDQASANQFLGNPAESSGSFSPEPAAAAVSYRDTGFPLYRFDPFYQQQAASPNALPQAPAGGSFAMPYAPAAPAQQARFPGNPQTPSLR